MELWFSFNVLYSDTKSRSVRVLTHKPKARVKVDPPIIQNEIVNHIM